MRPYFFTAMLMLASTGLMGGLTFMPRDGESVAVIFPSGTSREAAVEKVLAAGWLPEVFAEFRQLYPGIELSLADTLSEILA